MKVEFYRHNISDTDIRNATDVLHSLFLTTGPVCADFEQKFSAYTGIPHTISLSSCTAALHLSLLALGIGRGDEVITTPMTFIATATAILHTGAVPVLIDIDPRSGLMDTDKVEEAITSRTRAILPVHIYGTMADMVTLRKIADKHNLFIIEDAAHCIEGKRNSVRPGQLSDAVCYSFYTTKNLTCGEGGALATNDASLAEKVRALRLHGMSKEAAERYSGGYQHWDMIELGWKYNLDDIRASLLINQLDRLDENWKKRQAIFHNYTAALKNLPAVEIPHLHGKSAYHLFTIQVPASLRDSVLQYLNNKQIGCAVNYRAIHTLSWFQKNLPEASTRSLQNAERFGAQTLSIPFYPTLQPVEIEYVVKTLTTALQDLTN